jgi:hypothetical protein
LNLAWAEREGRSCLRVSGWTSAESSDTGGLSADRLLRRLAVLPSELVNAGGDFRALPPVAGRFEIDGDTICFIPRFPFLDGVSYSLLVDSSPEEGGVGGLEVWSIQRPLPEGASTTEIIAIYPSAGQLPVNQLKLYIYFFNPMSEGWVARSIQVRRADNQQLLEGVFLTMEPELWDAERRRLTLLLDPGRIKRGLVPNLEDGYPLIEGVPVIVTIAADFRDARGLPLRTGGERRYDIGPPLRARVNPAEWRCHGPVAGSTDPLTVAFDRPLDHAMLQHSLWVTNAAGEVVVGEGLAGPGEASWRFEPQSPWADGQYQVTVDHRLEDLAGNSLSRVFDRDLILAEDAPANLRQFAIDFHCAAPLRLPAAPLEGD